MPFIRRLWSKHWETSEDWDSDDPTQNLGRLVSVLELDFVWDLYLGLLHLVTPLIVWHPTVSFSMDVSRCVLLGLSWPGSSGGLPILPLLGLLAATVPFVIRMDFEGKLRRRLSGEYFEAHSMWMRLHSFCLWSLPFGASGTT